MLGIEFKNRKPSSRRNSQSSFDATEVVKSRRGQFHAASPYYNGPRVHSSEEAVRNGLRFNKVLYRRSHDAW